MESKINATAIRILRKICSKTSMARIIRNEKYRQQLDYKTGRRNQTGETIGLDRSYLQNGGLKLVEKVYNARPQCKKERGQQNKEI